MAGQVSGLVTMLFTDLVGSTELLSRAGDEEAQRIFRAHHDMLTDVAAAHSGEKVKWLGDGLMVAFSSTVDAVNCAIAMQRAAGRRIHGEHLMIRVGLNAGETMRETADYFGLPVVVARRLCDRAEAGQILCSELVTGLLAGRAGFAFDSLGALDLKGVPYPVTAFEVRYETNAARSLPSRLAFVGRQAEMGFLNGRLSEAAAGRGGLVMVVGEPGIGKTRLVEELAERARRDGWLTLWGRCYEGEGSPPYAPFVAALETHLAVADEKLRADLAPLAAPLAQLVAKVRDIFPDVAEPVPLQSNEERFRLLDSVARFLVARSRRAPVLICLDDLQWGDRGTIAMLRHVARFGPQHRIVVVCTYRDDEVDRSHPLTDTLRALRREVEFDALTLTGLDAGGTTELLAAAAGHDVLEAVGAAWAKETEGNPFFVQELLRHLIEGGLLYREEDGRLGMEGALANLSIPRGVRDVVERRLSLLSEPANKILGVAAAFEGPFSFDVLALVATVDQDECLDAIDEALAAHILRPADAPDTYAFASTLVRQTVYDGFSSSRAVRLHRRVAEALEATSPAGPTPAQSGEIAAQYHHSKALPGADQGSDHAIAAAAHAETSGAHDDAARFLRTALDLVPEADNRRARLLGRLGIALSWAATFDEAVAAASEAREAIAVSEGEAAAAAYVSEAMTSCLENLERMEALEATGLLDAPPRPEFDQLTSEAAERLDAPVAFMTLVDDNRQFFASSYGFPPEVRETPLEYSWCKFVAAFDEPFRVDDSLTHPLVRDTPLARWFGFRSYLGVPLRTAEGQPLGSFCVVSDSSRQWEPEAQEILEELAQKAMELAKLPADQVTCTTPVIVAG